jgi:hypothetical protein
MKMGYGNKNVVRRNSKTLLNSLGRILNPRTRNFHKVTGYPYDLILTVVKREGLDMKIIMNSHGCPQVVVDS